MARCSPSRSPFPTIRLNPKAKIYIYYNVFRGDIQACPGVFSPFFLAAVFLAHFTFLRQIFLLLL